MGFIISGQATGSVTTTVPGDSNAQNTTLLLSGNGSNNATNNTFVDSSSNNFAVTRVGNTTQGTFSPYGSNWSNYFDGTGDYLTVGTSANLSVSTSDFTIEAWVYLNSGSAYQYVLGATGNGGMQVGLNVPISGTPTIALGTANVAWILNFGASITIPTATWTHIAITRSGSTNRAFINGVQLGSNITDSTNWTFPNNSLQVGASRGIEVFGGYISNLRMVKGTAVYTSAFTPSTTPLTAITNTSLLTCQSNRFIDNSTNNFAITKNGDVSVQRFSPFAPSAAYSTSTIGGSAYFDGSGDYVYAAANAAFNIGSNDASVEMWCYSTSAGIIVMCGQNGGPYSSIRIVQYSVNYGYTINDDAGRDTGVPVILNAWTHLAVTVTGGTARMFVNGVLRNVATGIGSVRAQGDSYVIGAEEGIANFYQGYITDFRFVNGSIPTAYQTSSVTTGTTVFTPPTAPLTAVANTKLLLNYTNAGIVDSAMMTDLETVGDVKISTTQSKFGGSSMYFDGTGDYLITPANPVSNLGTGDFTIEMWVYLTNSEARTQTIMGGDLSTQSSSTNTIQIWYNNGASPNKISFNVYGNPRFDSSSSVSINNWMHLAFTRSSGTFKMFINGTQEASGSLPNNLSNNVFVVGRGYISFNQEYFNGYIDDLRVTKGVARYTANFTPPTAALAIGSVTSTTTGAIASGMTMSGTGTGMVISSYVAPVLVYPTWNPSSVSSSFGTFSNGNRTFIDNLENGSFKTAYPTKYSATGKFYFECTAILVSNAVNGLNYASVGIANQPPSSDFYGEQVASGYRGYTYASTANIATNDTYTPFGSTWTDAQSHIIGVAVDIDAGKVWFALDGVWQGSGNPATGTNPAFNIVTGRSYGFVAGNGASWGSSSVTGNWGQNTFAYTPPSGFIGQSI